MPGRAHPFLSRKGCKSDPRGVPLGYPPNGARCFPGSMGSDFSPNPGGQHHWIPPGWSEKSSAAAETAHAPAGFLCNIVRDARNHAAIETTARYLPREGRGPSGQQIAPWVFVYDTARDARSCVAIETTTRLPPPVGGAAWERALPARGRILGGQGGPRTGSCRPPKRQPSWGTGCRRAEA